MERSVQTAILMLIVAALFTVLVTPDLGDDVAGVLHKTHLELAALLGCVHFLRMESDPSTIAALTETFPRGGLVCERLDLNCIRLC